LVRFSCIIRDKTAFRKAQRRGKEREIPKPRYEREDVYAIFALPARYIEYDEPIELGSDILVNFKNAGHILDSAIIEIHIEEEGAKKVSFSAVILVMTMLW